METAFPHVPLEMTPESVRYWSANQDNSAFYPAGVGTCVAIHVFTWITEVGTFNNGRLGLREAV